MEDIIIIGGGPVGIYAATLASLHNLKGILIEGLDVLGGQLTSLYPEKDIIDLPGFSRITAKGFIDELIKQAESRPNPIAMHVEERVLSFDKIEGGYKITTNKGEYETKTILLSTGMGVFQPRKTGLANEDSFNNIIYSLKKKDVYKDKKIAILGGGDSAVDWAIMLADIAQKVYIIHRRDEFRAQSSSVSLMEEKGVEVLRNYALTAFEGDESVRNVHIVHNVSKEEKILDVDAVFVNYGTITAPCSFLIEKAIGATFKVGPFYQTSQENIFAVGNAIHYEGKVKNITSGLGEAVIAITKIDQIINPGKNIPVHF